MDWMRLSSKEWRRRPLRTAVTVAGVAIATAALFSLLAFQSGYREGVGHELDRLGAHILVVPKGCPYDAASIALHGASWPCYLKARYVEEIRSVSGVAAVAPVLMIAEYDTAGGQNVYSGIDTNMLSLKRAWRIEGKFPELEGQLLAGADAARRNAWKIGDSVRLPGDDQQSGRVAGIIDRTYGPEDSFIYMRLSGAQARFLHINELTHILVRLSDPDKLEQAFAQLRGCDAGLSMNVVPLSHLFQTIQAIVSSTRMMLGCIALVGLLAAGTGVTNTILMAGL